MAADKPAGVRLSDAESDRLWCTLLLSHPSAVWVNVRAAVESILTARASTAQDEAGEVAQLRAQVAAVEALAGEWEADFGPTVPEMDRPTKRHARRLRAALGQATGGER